jgi:hypothetical protein
MLSCSLILRSHLLNKVAQKSFLKDGNKVNNPAAETAGCNIHKMSVNWGDR